MINDYVRARSLFADTQVKIFQKGNFNVCLISDGVTYKCFFQHSHFLHHFPLKWCLLKSQGARFHIVFALLVNTPDRLQSKML